MTGQFYFFHISIYLFTYLRFLKVKYHCFPSLNSNFCHADSLGLASNIKTFDVHNCNSFINLRGMKSYMFLNCKLFDIRNIFIFTNRNAESRQ